MIALLAVVSGCAAAPQERSALLRYGDRTPVPQGEFESILYRGEFVGDMTPLDKLGRLCRGTLAYRGREMAVFVKHAYFLHELQQREGIPFHSDNRNADAAYQVNRALGLVDTPEHVLRDDVPTCGGPGQLSSAGVQRFLTESRATTKAAVSQLMSRSDLLDEIEEMAVFDVVIGNTDRHDLNWRFREEPAASERKLIAIDHSLAFPVHAYARGNYVMVDRYLASSRRGNLTDPIREKLEGFLRQRGALDPLLRLNLNPKALELMWSRVDRLLEDGRVFSLQPPPSRRTGRRTGSSGVQRLPVVEAGTTSRLVEPSN